MDPITDLPTTNHGIMTASDWTSLAQQPVFPAHIAVEGATVALSADGTWDGDPDALAAAMEGMRGQLPAEAAMVLWLILREMRRDRADAAAAERIMENGERMKAAWDADRT